MKNKFVIYDPPMCCSSGLCGPNVDQGLVDLNTAITDLTKTGVEVERYIITQSPEKFKENPQIIKLIQEQQLKALPITTFNGTVVKMGSYPTIAEFNDFLKGNLEVKVTKISTKDDDCCGDGNCCGDGCC